MVPVVTAFLIVSASGCSLFLNCWLIVGVVNCGDVSVMPVVASVTDSVSAEETRSDGRVGLLFWQAIAAADSASALQRLSVLSFICSHRG